MFHDGDFLVFQLESGYALLRVIAVDQGNAETIWHLAAFDEFFLDVEHAEAVITGETLPKLSHAHIALTNRAFESTQVAKLINVPLTNSDREAYQKWQNDPNKEVSDRSVRLMLGLR